MRITPQVSQVTIVAVGHFNPLILRPDWLRNKDLIIGSDSEQLHIEVMHASWFFSPSRGDGYIVTITNS
jgi:hypothetical protein